MNFQWDPKVGPAAIIGIIMGLGTLVTVGIAWGSLKSDVQTSVVMATDAKNAARQIAERTSSRDTKVAEQSERIGRIETAVTFMVPALQRIEQKLDAK